jgi:hypothetical protein
MRLRVRNKNVRSEWVNLFAGDGYSIRVTCRGPEQ